MHPKVWFLKIFCSHSPEGLNSEILSCIIYICNHLISIFVLVATIQGLKKHLNKQKAILKQKTDDIQVILTSSEMNDVSNAGEQLNFFVSNCRWP